MSKTQVDKVYRMHRNFPNGYKQIVNQKHGHTLHSYEDEIMLY